MTHAPHITKIKQPKNNEKNNISKKHKTFKYQPLARALILFLPRCPAILSLRSLNPLRPFCSLGGGVVQAGATSGRMWQGQA